MAIFSGTMMDDMLMGTMDDDVLWGGMGNDDLSGGAGDDRLIGGPGADTLNGGPGKDIASYTGSPRGVHVDMRTEFVETDDERDAIRGGHAEGDSLSSIEVVWGSEHGDIIVGTHAHNDLFGNGGSDKLNGWGGNDLLRGGGDDDELSGGPGNDKLYGDMGVDSLMGGAGHDMLFGGMDQDILNGGLGHDMLAGGADADQLDGGPGSDTAIYAMSPEAVMVDLRYQDPANRANPAIKAPAGGEAMGDDLMNIENLRGSAHADTLIGDDPPETDNAATPDYDETKAGNKLYGNMGDDMLKGMGGNDTLHGGKGDDTLYGGKGDDDLMGEIGDDALKGEEGVDTLAGGAGADKLFGGKFDVETQTPSTDDEKDGMLDLDPSSATFGEIIKGDTADYSKSDAGVTIDLSKTVAGAVMGEGGHAEGDSLVGIENLIGSMHDDELSGTDPATDGTGGANVLMGMDGDDTLRGRGGNDVLSGGKGDDTLRAGDNNDIVLGGTGDDEINAGLGIDTIDGGAGDDVFFYEGMSINDAPAAEPTGFTTAYINETSIRAAEWADGADVNTAGVFTPAFDSKVDGGGGMDTIDASEATGTYDRTPTDTTDNPLGVYVDLNVQVVTNYKTGDTDNPKFTPPSATGVTPVVTQVDAKYANVYTSIEEVIGGDGDDKLVGNSRASTTLKGGGGEDRLEGGRGADMLVGGSGDDTLKGGNGSDTFVYNSGMDTIEDFEISVRGGATDKIDIKAKDLSPTELQTILDTSTRTPGDATKVLVIATEGDTQGTYIKFDGSATDRVEATDFDIFLSGVLNEGADKLEVGDFIL